MPAYEGYGSPPGTFRDAQRLSRSTREQAASTPRPATPPPTQAPAQPQAQQPQTQTFAQLQAAGQARPAPPPTVFAGQAFAPQQQPSGTADALLKQLMANPSSYGTEAMNREYTTRAGAIDDETTLATRNLEGEMARRGIFDSNIAGDRTRGLINTNRDAKVQLADSLFQKLAETNAADQRSAIGLGLESDRNRDARDASARSFSLQSQNIAMQRQQFERELEMDRERLGLTRQEMEDRRQQFEREMTQRDQQYSGSREDRRYEYDNSMIRDLIDLLGGYEGLGSPTAGEPVTGGGYPGNHVDPLPTGGGGYSGGGGGTYTGGNDINPDELLRLLEQY